MKRSEQVEIIKVIAGERSQLLDDVAVEEPLQITIDGVPIAVVMRTVGDDADLVAGFLVTEGIITTLDAISRIDLEQKKNHALVFIKDDVELDLSSLQRNLYSASSCGICGKASIDEVFQKAAELKDELSVRVDDLLQAPDKLREAQETFETTGGLHAAGLFSYDGNLLVLKEDVGRHNAIDKVIGAAMKNGHDFSQSFLQLSGRVSFEVVQKALMAGIPMVAAISAPTSLAVSFAEESQMTLVAFMRGQKFNIYSHSNRVI